MTNLFFSVHCSFKLFRTIVIHFGLEREKTEVALKLVERVFQVLDRAPHLSTIYLALGVLISKRAHGTYPEKMQAAQQTYPKLLKKLGSIRNLVHLSVTADHSEVFSTLSKLALAPLQTFEYRALQTRNITTLPIAFGSLRRLTLDIYDRQWRELLSSPMMSLHIEELHLRTQKTWVLDDFNLYYVVSSPSQNRAVLSLMTVFNPKQRTLAPHLCRRKHLRSLTLSATMLIFITSTQYKDLQQTWVHRLAVLPKLEAVRFGGYTSNIDRGGPLGVWTIENTDPSRTVQFIPMEEIMVDSGDVFRVEIDPITDSVKREIFQAHISTMGMLL